MNDFIKKLKEDSKFLLTLMLVLVVIVLLFFFFWAGLVLFFFIGLFVWIVFIVLYLRVLFKVSFLFRIFIFLFLIILTFFLIYKAVPEKFGSKDTTSSKKRVLVDCTSTAQASTSKVSGWNTYLYPSDWTLDRTPGPTEKSGEQKSSYSMANIGEKGVSNIFYYIEKADRSNLPSDTKRVIEVCDANNKTYKYWTTATTTTTGASEGVVATESYVQKYNINENKVPGDFRIDAYLYTNGKWTLTDRVNKINFVK